ncbi:MAG: hypothetical protein ACI4OE_06990 [Alphaproteobacteria bacterium]
MFKEFVLPDGTLAESPSDVDRFLKTNDLVLEKDYSAEYRKNIRLRNEKAQRDSDWAIFLSNYKRMIWNE